MDPITHTFTGAALSAAGLRRTTPLATATLIVAANAPDIDVFAYFAGPYAALAFRRGWTHGPLALVVLPVVIACAMLLYDRGIRRRAAPADSPARAGPLLGLAAIGVASHPILDWLNNYGLRWLMPFDGRWSHGDALFIIDPWVWLALGGGLFLVYSREPAAIGAWAAFAALATYLILNAPVLLLGKLLWLASVAALVFLRARTPPGRRTAAAQERVVRRASVGAGAYVVAALAATAGAKSEVQASVDPADTTFEAVGVSPSPANPFTAGVVAVTPGAYHTGSLSWFRSPRVVLGPDSIPRQQPDAVTRAAMRVPEARDYLTWARFPFFEVDTLEDGYLVRISDARYADAPGAGSLRGLTVHVDANLRARLAPPPAR